MTGIAINGRRIKDGLKCPICDSVLTPQDWEHYSGMQLCTGTGIPIPGCRDCPALSLKMICVGCCAEVDIVSSGSKIEHGDMDTLKKLNDIYQSDWEYVIMSIASVKYGRVKNLGDYETERFEAEVILDPGQEAEDAASEAKAFVKKQLGLGPTDVELDAARDLLREAGEL